MKRLRAPLLILLLLLGPAPAVFAQGRLILYGKNPPSDGLREVAEALADPKTPRASPRDPPAAGAYFVRLTQRAHILNPDSSLKPTAALHVLPYVFITPPKGLYGRPLLEIFAEIGYEAEYILSGQLGKETVAVVFRYPEGVALSEVSDGRLPADWERRVFVPTWENVFALFHALARKDKAETDRAASDKNAPAPRLGLNLSEADLNFVVGFPEEGKRRVRCVPYAVLRAGGGADWRYRRLLEEKLSLFEHFRGNGRTQNELVDPDGVRPERGLREYVGPKMALKELDEFAVVALGALTVGPAFGTPPEAEPPPNTPAPACAGAPPCCCH